MHNISLNANKIEVLFNNLQQELGGVLNIFNKEYSLSINNTRFQGKIMGSSINKNISFIDFDIRPKEDLCFEYNALEVNPIYFIYVTQGQLTFNFKDKDAKHNLEQFQTGIFSSEPPQNTGLIFKKNQRICTSVILVNTRAVEKEQEADLILRERLLETFMPNDKASSFYYIGSYNLTIAERIKQLNAIKQEGLVRRLLTKGIVFTILGLEIEQHKKDIAHLKNKTGSLSVDEMATVKEFAEFIQNYPERPYSLEVISRKTALSPAKLQEGFKILHNRTVSDYIRNVRVERAEKMIRTTDLNISEIVYSIGLTSRSYFSKIFKKKYNCSPKNYQDHQRRAAVKA